MKRTHEQFCAQAFLRKFSRSHFRSCDCFSIISSFHFLFNVSKDIDMEIFQRKKKKRRRRRKEKKIYVTQHHLRDDISLKGTGNGFSPRSKWFLSQIIKHLDRRNTGQNTAKILSLAVFRISSFLKAATRLSLPHFASSVRHLSTVSRIMATAKRSFKRLPTNVLPKNYKLTLQPNLTEFTFTGKEDIEVEVCGMWYI